MRWWISDRHTYTAVIVFRLPGKDKDMTVCCAGTLEFVESLVEDVYIYVRHFLLPFNEMAQEHRTGHRRNWGGGS